ncbi:hypothetical protein FI667_g7660, partial [Globisporangium splendens]
MDGPAQESAVSTNAAADERLTPEDLTFLYTFATTHNPPNSCLKRPRSLTEDFKSDEDGPGSDDTSSTATTSPMKATTPHSDNSDGGQCDKVPSPSGTAMPAIKQRRRSTVVNRELKEQLYDELMYLEARAALLRHETGKVEPQVIKSKRALRAELSEAVLQHDLQFAAMQSMLSGFANSRVTSPLESYIHLTTDWQQRRGVLLAMKQQKIDVAHRFMVERTRFMNPFQEFSEQSQYTTRDGDFCMIKMDATPFEGVTSVRQVFNAVQFYMMNLDVTLAKISDNITIRETDENDETIVLQHRFATSERDGVLVEKNGVVFVDTSRLNCDNVDDQSALFTIDFVDRDDLYPYCPNQRLRNDSTCVMKLSAHRRKRAAVPTSTNLDTRGSGGNVGEEDELMVVLTRWSRVQLRRSQIAVPKSVLRSIADDLTGGFDHMIKTMREGGCRISNTGY